MKILRLVEIITVLLNKKTVTAASLANQYGDLVARYKNAICFVKDAEHIYESMDDSLSGEKFILTKIPHTKRVIGFPLDSLSKHIKSGDYYYDIGDLRSDVVTVDNGFREFFKENLM